MSEWPLDGIDPVAFGAALSQLPPTHELVAAARAAVDISDSRHDDARALAAAGREVSAECRGLSTEVTMTRAALAARAAIDGPARLARFDAPPARDPVEPARDPAGTAAAVNMARDWANDHAAALDARQHELSQWHADQAVTERTTASTDATVPEQAGAPAMERIR